MRSTKTAISNLSDEALAAVAGAITGGIVAGLNRNRPEVSARAAEAPDIFYTMFEALRNLQQQCEPDASEPD